MIATKLTKPIRANRMYIRWENPRKQRYYEAYLGQDLFGWCLTLVWGRKASALGRMRHLPCHDYAQGRERVEKLKQQRQARGYQMCRVRDPL